MLFRRRERPHWIARARVALWPRRSFGRSFRYLLLRLKRTDGSPHAIAIGFAAGVFVACTPYLGIQVISAAALAYLLRGSLLASFLGTFFGNPLTYPLIWAATYKVGIVLLRETDRFDGLMVRQALLRLKTALVTGSPDLLASSSNLLLPLLKPMSIGALPLGAIFAGACYCMVRHVVVVYQKGRQTKGMQVVRLDGKPDWHASGLDNPMKPLPIRSLKYVQPPAVKGGSVYKASPERARRPSRQVHPYS